MRSFLLGIVVSVAACGGTSSKPAAPPASAAAEAPPAAPPPSDRAPAVATISKFRDRMCACADKACADAITNEMTQWGQAESDRIAKTGPAKVSDEDTRQIAALVEQLAQCMTKLMGAGSASQ